MEGFPRSAPTCGPSSSVMRSTAPPPQTQSVLLGAMAEGNVSVDGTTHALPRPFMVIATQNPYEMAGTYPLPEVVARSVHGPDPDRLPLPG